MFVTGTLRVIGREFPHALWVGTFESQHAHPLTCSLERAVDAAAGMCDSLSCVKLSCVKRAFAIPADGGEEWRHAELMPSW